MLPIGHAWKEGSMMDLIETAPKMGLAIHDSAQVVYLQPAGNSDRPPIRYNTPFTTYVRGLCHGIQPRFLPARGH